MGDLTGLEAGSVIATFLGFLSKGMPDVPERIEGACHNAHQEGAQGNQARQGSPRRHPPDEVTLQEAREIEEPAGG